MSYDLNIKLLKSRFRKLYWAEGEIIKPDPRYSIKIGDSHLISFYPNILKNYKKLNSYRIGRLLGYICPSSNYGKFQYGIQYFAVDGNKQIFLYGQKIPDINEHIISIIYSDISKMNKILKMHVIVVIK